ncbi:FadR family transcriptional regulator [Mobiluncus mulieris]|uniref:Transcriptional regulator, GntR family n=2 Tax=Mobiluncus mulieris TaxID=2052 RepID=E0QS94_9ACTO|nr:GntR family transcriptional regulator [Mobiluncus mulieris]EFM45575.1 transcriptional regulator, GntR family [Mobiluncus mulieris ATCC 35239]MCU9972151.1 FadR family transcriptional regulator [Mobiluncus mulieris]MCU9976560.1 FadR family transcriptional regulator [Mobiluncus mulieris]MCU9997396.1 FadR family transcriptional regulator [Mobiluncus mulieris]MCV0014893.1 FadR family transcriptional regulator [Mobiluncus mulieris]
MTELADETIVTPKIRRRTSGDAATAAEQIKALILGQHLKPGDSLPTESELTSTLGISRSSVREALRHLEALDIVKVRRGVGAFVGPLSMSALVETLAFKTILTAGNDLQALREVIAVRRYLDLGLAPTVCQTLRGNPQPGLEALVRLMRTKAEAGQTFPDEDFAFHDGILALLNNDLARQLVASFWQVHLAALRSMEPPNHESLLTSASAHGEILRAATAGNIAEYQQAIIRHYSPVYSALNLT